MLKISLLQAILFDLDQTLLDREAGFQAWTESLFERAGVAELSERERLASILAGADAEGYGDRGAFGLAVAENLPALGMDGESAIRDFYEHLPRSMAIDPGTPAMLLNLKRRYKVGLVTNGGGKTQREKMRRAGLGGDHFDAIVISGEEGVSKPDPAIFQAALERLGIGEPERALFIGDHEENDIAGAKGAGLLACWIRRPGRGQPPEADFAIESVAQLPRLLASR